MTINKIDRRDVKRFKDQCEYQFDGDCNLLDLYQEIAGQSAIYPGKGTAQGIMYCSLKLNGEAGELAEHVGKAMRDDGFGNVLSFGAGNTPAYLASLTEERRQLIIKEIGDNLWYLQALCRELGITLSQAALINLQKLCDRGERDVLQGSGDNR